MSCLRQLKLVHSLHWRVLQHSSSSILQAFCNAKDPAKSYLSFHNASYCLHKTERPFVGYERKATHYQSTFTRAFNLKRAERTILDPPRKAQKKEKSGHGQIVSAREQRRADWAILKEMSQYLWPQVENRKTPQAI